MSKQPRLDGMEGPLFVVPPEPKLIGPKMWHAVLPCPTTRCTVSERRRDGLCIHCGRERAIKPFAELRAMYCETCFEKNNRWLRGEG